MPDTDPDTNITLEGVDWNPTLGRLRLFPYTTGRVLFRSSSLILFAVLMAVGPSLTGSHTAWLVASMVIVIGVVLGGVDIRIDIAVDGRCINKWLTLYHIPVIRFKPLSFDDVVGVRVLMKHFDSDGATTRRGRVAFVFAQRRPMTARIVSATVPGPRMERFVDRKTHELAALLAAKLGKPIIGTD